MQDFITSKWRALLYHGRFFRKLLQRKGCYFVIRMLSFLQCIWPKGDGRKVATGWTLSVTGGIKNHMIAIQRYSTFAIQIFPSTLCNNIATLAGLTKELTGTLGENELARFDLVHSHVEPFFVNLCAEVAKRKIPWVHTFHTLYFPEDWGGTLALWQKEINHCLLKTARLADIRISVSRWLQELLYYQYGIETVYIPNGVDLSKCQSANPKHFTERYGLNEFALFVGAGDEIKNPHDFVRLAGCFPDVDFVMIGTQLDRKALRQMIKSELPMNIRLMGVLPHEMVLDAIAACRVFVMTSRSEGLPTVLMEAMALERTVVGPDRFGIKEVICDERFGYLYHFDDLADLNYQFKCALDNKTRGMAARARVEAEYDWAVVIKRLDNVYRNLLQ